MTWKALAKLIDKKAIFLCSFLPIYIYIFLFTIYIDSFLPFIYIPLYIYIFIYIYVPFYPFIPEMLFVGKMHQKKANTETLFKIWFVLFVPWLPSSMRNHDGKWVFYDYHIYHCSIPIHLEKLPSVDCPPTHHLTKFLFQPGSPTKSQFLPTK